MSLKELAELIFPNVSKTPLDYFEQYGTRNLSNGQLVTRYAPSPTGFQHIGGVFAALIAQRLAQQSGGVFYLRIEDTDQKREVEGAVDDTIATLKKYGICFDEGMMDETTSIGEFGPYRQSERMEIYQAFAKALIARGVAYPCFATAEELSELRERQIADKLTPGYYGEFAMHRNLTPDEAATKIEAGEPYVIRLKSPGDGVSKVTFQDLVKGEISFTENNQDIVIIKGDGLPTYHFAHAVDDALMQTSLISRGEEWLSSLPIHVQLFDVLGIEAPAYAHIPTIMKLDGSSKRKLSKRKDAESAVSYYDEEGFPIESVIEYLLHIVNSTYEEWRTQNPMAHYNDYVVSLDKISKSGALFDIVKLYDVSKDVISKMSAERMYELYVAWAKDYDLQMYDFAVANEVQLKTFFGIDKDSAKPRKDYGKWSDVRAKIEYLSDELFEKDSVLELPKGLDIGVAKDIIGQYSKIYDHNLSSQEEWFEHLKKFAEGIGYCANRKEFKKNPDLYKGMVSDVAGAVRCALTHRANTPDLHVIMQILGEDVVKSRFASFINS